MVTMTTTEKVLSVMIKKGGGGGTKTFEYVIKGKISSPTSYDIQTVCCLGDEDYFRQDMKHHLITSQMGFLWVIDHYMKHFQKCA